MEYVSEPSVRVTLAEISRIAGVGRAAVSNWRRRYESFPAPVGGSDTSPQFALDEVQVWLRENGKVKGGSGPEWLWPEFEALGDREAMGLAIAEVGSRLVGDDAVRHSAPRRLVERAVAEDARTPGVFDFLLRRWLETHVRQLSTTPAPLARLMAELAGSQRAQGFTDVRSVADPACGTGELLLAAARSHENATLTTAVADQTLAVVGRDIDPVQSALASARLRLAAQPSTRGTVEARRVKTRSRRSRFGVPWEVQICTGDSLRAEPDPRKVDVVLCAPPTNQRDWGHEEIATDPRWSYGIPPRSEPELAWVQHAVAQLAPCGVAVMLLPPAIAARRAGKQIRAALLRSGVLRAVIALPSGTAPPYSISLHLWVLSAPTDRPPSAGELLLVDATTADAEQSRGGDRAGRTGFDRDVLYGRVLAAVQGAADSGVGCARVPVIDLLDEHVDLTPARHVTHTVTASGTTLKRSWARMESDVEDLRRLSATLSRLRPAGGRETEPDVITVGDLVRGGALEIHSGQTPSEERVRDGDPPEDAVPVLTLHDLLVHGGASRWLPTEEATVSAVLTAPGDVVVAGSTRAFDAWVEVAGPTALGSQLHALRAAPGHLDPWFLAGCLRAPVNARRAGTHATATSRVDVRRLRVLRLPLTEQRRYGEVFRQVIEFERALRGVWSTGSELVGNLNDALSEGRLRPE
ncbi:N-6 DNA methylase [Streptomonospora nanhaiensis]|uniref:N-6 DNA methylase n=1 Tax=Streptomonospora nanhaiensis TaxID=1323731 RepID=UPI001C98FC9C|nr:N-6 DNA methylase [Streptomonospora nanhaiensis]MBX9386931.1 SAM-dependent methyltransferase [Streptomonospora nanhaiensis]